MEKGLQKRLNDLEKNRQTINIKVLGSIASLGLITGTIEKVREDHIVLKQSNSNSHYMLPINQIETISY